VKKPRRREEAGVSHLGPSRDFSERSVRPERVKGDGWPHAENQLLNQPASQGAQEDSVAMMAGRQDQAVKVGTASKERHFVRGERPQSRPGAKQDGRADGRHQLRYAADDRVRASGAIPAFASQKAVAHPITPPPTITTSAPFGSIGLAPQRIINSGFRTPMHGRFR
jgi:hypothetical protein